MTDDDDAGAAVVLQGSKLDLDNALALVASLPNHINEEVCERLYQDVLRVLDNHGSADIAWVIGRLIATCAIHSPEPRTFAMAYALHAQRMVYLALRDKPAEGTHDPGATTH
jgi:hypothetical protein